MSNKRRKSIGSAKIARNLQIRLRRGAAKAGTPRPGYSEVYRVEGLHPSYKTHGDQLREAQAKHTDSYWGQ